MQKIPFIDIIKAQERIFESVVFIMTTGEKIQNLRQKKGWSQERLGQELNLSRQSISKWESGTATPTVDNLKELAKIFDVSVDSLLGNEINIPDKEENKRVDNKKDKFIKILPFVLTGIIAVIAIVLIVSQVKMYNRLEWLENRINSLGVTTNTVYVPSAKNSEQSLFTSTEIKVQKYYQNRTMDILISVLPKSDVEGTKVEFSITDEQVITTEKQGQSYNAVVNVPWVAEPTINASIIKPDGTIENETLYVNWINEDLFEVRIEPAYNARGVYVEFCKIYGMDYISGSTENLLSGQPSFFKWKVTQDGKTIKTGTEKIDNYEEYESMEQTILDENIKGLDKNKKFSVTLDITDVNGIKTTLEKDIQLY